MKDIYKNPTLYYILLPIVVALWPLLVWGLYLPSSRQSWDAEKKQYIKAQSVMDEIRKIDPDRLQLADSKAAAEFDYANAVETIAGLCKISAASYSLSTQPERTSDGQKSQSARVALKQVGIEQFAEFLSTIQLRWANLQCTSLKLTARKGLKDKWDADLDFKYYY